MGNHPSLRHPTKETSDTTHHAMIQFSASNMKWLLTRSSYQQPFHMYAAYNANSGLLLEPLSLAWRLLALAWLWSRILVSKVIVGTHVIVIVIVIAIVDVIGR